MVIVLKHGVTQDEIEHIIEKIEKLGLKTHISHGEERTIIGAIGDETKLLQKPIDAVSGVEKVMPITQPFKLASREFHPEDTVINIDGRQIGGNKIGIIAGPCTVENEAQTINTARAVQKAGAHFLRGGAFKPRTSPYSFQGLGEEGLKILSAAKQETGLPICTEVMDTRFVELVAKYSDIIQIGARNMQNFDLLKEVGKVKKPVLLKRGMMSTIKELLMSAEYIMSNGNYQVMLCERGIRTFETATRNTLDLSCIPVLKELSHLPIIIDPSHATGKRNYVASMTKASIAGGADGITIEVHINPEEALVDGAQSLYPEEFEKVMEELKPISSAIGKEI